MRKVAFDIESHLIRPGMLFPKLVCVSMFEDFQRKLFLAEDGCREIIRLLRDPDTILVGHNVPFDLGVIIAEIIERGLLPAHEIVTLVFQAYADNRITDTMVRTMLVDIARGTFQEIEGQRRGKVYGLDHVAFRWIGKVIQKKDTWRLHYAYLDGVPLSQWPQEAIDYAIGDAEVTFQVDNQISTWAMSEGIPTPGNIPDEFRQVRAAWVLHLMAGWGVKIDSVMVEGIRQALEAQRTKAYAIMDQYGLFKKKHGQYQLTKKGQRSINQKILKSLIADGYAKQNISPPTTAGRKNKAGIRTPEVACDADTARESGHPGAVAYADVANCIKLLSTYVPALERGKGGFPVTSSPNVLVASGRTSWQGPNWQNPPKVGGIRECVIPRKGKVFVDADLDTVELRALAQACLEIVGYSQMAAALQQGKDLHTALAAEILGIDYDDCVDRINSGDPVAEEARAVAKQVNFGLPGGMGAKKFAQTCIDGGSPLIKDPTAPFEDHVARAYQLKEIWFRRWPEMRPYLDNASRITGDFGTCSIVQPWSERLRGGLDYCSCANTYFQGRVADGTKLALWRLAWACYVDTTSILYGSRLVLFLHDEVILECDEEIASECADEVVRILCGAVQEVIPTIPITSKPVIMRRWYKGAKPLKMNGRWLPVRPVKDPVTKKTKWVHDV